MTTDAATFVLEFGKHRGKSLAEVPAGYLAWLLDNATNLYPQTRRAIEDFLRPPDGGQASRQFADRRKSADRPAGRRRTANAGAKAEVAAATCATCGLPGTAERPLVHEKCRDDEVPF